MSEMTDELLARIAVRASDPKRRYMTAAEDESKVAMPLEEIERRYEAWQAKLIERSRAAALRDGMTLEEYERNLARDLEDQRRRRGGRSQLQFEIAQWSQLEWNQGRTFPEKLTFVETEHSIGWSMDTPGAKPLVPPPEGSDWLKLERVVGRKMPEDLKQLYSLSDGGFGPGFTGLNPVETIGINWNDLRRRGPDYCGTVEYPASFLPIAGEMLDYHYDLDTGRIISSDQDWHNHDLEPEDIYDIAFDSLAAMMEDWLERS